MDPLTAIGLIASLANLIEACSDVIKLIRTLRNSDKELVEVCNSVSLFEENLKGFDRVLRSSSSLHTISVETVNNAIRDSTDLMKELHDRLLSVTHSENSAMRSVKWVQFKSTFKRITQGLEAKCGLLHSLVSVAQMEIMLSMCNQNPQLFEICTDVADEMSRESSSVDLKLERQRSSSSFSSLPIRHHRSASTDEGINKSVAPRVSEKDSTTSCRESASSAPRSYLMPGTWTPRGSLVPQDKNEISRRRLSNSSMNSATTFQSSIGSVTSSVFDSNSTASSSSSISRELDPIKPFARSSQGIEPERRLVDSLVIRRSCRFDCFCRCHSQTITVPDSLLHRFNSPVFMDGTTPGPKIECSEPDCVGESGLQARAIPSGAFFQRAMSRLSSAHSIKANVQLNTYRMVPEGTDAMRYAKQGNLEKLKLSMELGESTIWDTAPDGWSLLHTAVYARQLPIVKYLCEHGADTQTSDIGARKPVDLAILKSLTVQATDVEKQIVQILAKQDDFLIDFEFTPIHLAVLNLYDASDSERPSLTKLIDFVDDANNAEPGVDWSRWKSKYKRRSPLFLTIIEQFRASACESSNAKKVIHNLLDQKDRKFHWTPLHWASSIGRRDLMKILIDAGADPFITSNLDANIIHAAVESNAVESLAYSLSISQDHPTRLNIDRPNVWGETPLMMAAQGGLVECVRLLLEAGADRNVRQENQQVALHYAGLSKRGIERRQIVSLLCGSDDDDGVDTPCSHINAQDEDGRPPIFDFLDDTECTEILLRHAAKLDLRDTSGKNIFHQACIQNHSEQLDLLLRVSATDPTEKDHDGNTPLVEALRHDSIACAEILLEAGAVGDMVGQNGWTAAHYATKIGDPELLEIVLRHPGYEKGARTRDGKTVQVVAMESGNWCGKVKELLRRYNSIA